MFEQAIKSGGFKLVSVEDADSYMGDEAVVSSVEDASGRRAATVFTTRLANGTRELICLPGADVFILLDNLN